MEVSNKLGEPLVCRIPFGAKFEVAPDHIRFIPSRIAEMTAGMTEEKATISSQSTEILLCHRYWQELRNGWRIVIRAANGDEQELGGRVGLHLRESDIKMLTGAITAAVGLPVRVVTRRTTLHGAVEETPWMPETAKLKVVMPIAFPAAGLPFVGGIVMGWISPGPEIAVLVGLALWLCLMLVVFAMARGEHQKFPAMRALTTLVTFSATYLVCFLFTQYIAHPH
jgi:hypothetical protein